MTASLRSPYLDTQPEPGPLVGQGPPAAEAILKRVARKHGLTPAELLDAKRWTSRVVARRELYVELRALGWAVADVARFTGRDVSTILNALRKTSGFAVAPPLAITGPECTPAAPPGEAGTTSAPEAKPTAPPVVGRIQDGSAAGAGERAPDKASTHGQASPLHRSERDSRRDGAFLWSDRAAPFVAGLLSAGAK